LNSQFTYSTRTGNKVRSYMKVAFVIFAVIAALAVVAAVNRNQLVAEVMATPRPLDANLISTETAVFAAPAAPVEDCPSNPASWTFSGNPTAPGSNHKMPPSVFMTSLKRRQLGFMPLQRLDIRGLMLRRHWTYNRKTPSSRTFQV
jgi:hypothetical protein